MRVLLTCILSLLLTFRVAEDGAFKLPARSVNIVP